MSAMETSLKVLGYINVFRKVNASFPATMKKTPLIAFSPPVSLVSNQKLNRSSAEPVVSRLSAGFSGLFCDPDASCTVLNPREKSNPRPVRNVFVIMADYSS